MADMPTSIKRKPVFVSNTLSNLSPVILLGLRISRCTNPALCNCFISSVKTSSQSSLFQLQNLCNRRDKFFPLPIYIICFFIIINANQFYNQVIYRIGKFHFFSFMANITSCILLKNLGYYFFIVCNNRVVGTIKELMWITLLHA